MAELSDTGDGAFGPIGVARVAALFVALCIAAGSTLWSPGEGALAGISASPHNGDVDCSGRVDSVDAALVLQYSAGLSITVPCPLNAVADGYFPVTSVDASLILQYAAGLVDQLPPILELTGTVTSVRGVEADCLALDTGREQLVFFDPAGLTEGQHVRVTGYIDAYASFCGISPLLHNVSVRVLE